MTEPLLQTALRVLACYTGRLTHPPEQEDLARLRGAVPEEHQGKAPDLLAVFIIERETKKRRTNGWVQ